MQAGRLISCGTMGWEKRANHIYYYRKERDGSRVRSIYLGRGENALLASRLTTLHREECKEMRNARLAEREVSRRTDDELDKLQAACDALMAATLLMAGFHTHKRQWRKMWDGRTHNREYRQR